MGSGWIVLEDARSQKILERSPPQVRQKYEFWKEQIIDGGPMGVRRWKGFHDHALKGRWQGYRSSYLNSQYRVIYFVDARRKAVVVTMVGPHKY